MNRLWLLFSISIMIKNNHAFKYEMPYKQPYAITQTFTDETIIVVWIREEETTKIVGYPQL